MTGHTATNRWWLWMAIVVVLVLGAVLAPTEADAGQGTPPLITVFESGGISERTADEIADLDGPVYERHTGTLRMMSVSRGDEVIQTFPPGMGVPMTVSSWDSISAVALLGQPVATLLERDGVVMSLRSAAMRGAAVGDTIVLEGWNGALVELDIVGIVDDVDMDWSELAMNRSVAESVGLTRLSLVAAPGDSAEAAMLRQRLADMPVRVIGPDDEVDRTDFVLPTVMVKERFGEFSFRPTRGDAIEIDPAWEEANIVTVDIEPLGLFECHRLVVPYIRSVVEDLRSSGMLGEVDPADFQLAGGCFNARLIRGGDKGFALSRHSWGIAIDINPSTNRYDGAVGLSDAFGQTFRDWGFSWGASWLRPDGMHFEWARIGVPEERSCSATTLAPSRVPGVTWSVVERIGSCR